MRLKIKSAQPKLRTEKRSSVLLRHSSFPAGYDDQAYIFTKSMPAGKIIKLCRKNIITH